MIVLPGRLARDFASILRRCRARDPVVLLRGGRGGPCLEANSEDMAVRLGQPGKQPEAVLIEEWHLALYLPGDLHETRAIAIREALDGAALRVRLLRALTEVVRAHPGLDGVHVRLSR